MRRLSLAAFGLLAVVLLASCVSGGSQPTATATSADKAAVAPEALFPVTVTDDRGKSITLEKAPSRIVSLAPSNTEILFALGLGDKVVGVDEYSNFPPEAKIKEKVGGFATVNMEKVVALGPDLILAAGIHAKTIAPELEQHGLKVLLLEPPKVEAVLDRILTVGKATGHAKEADNLVKELRQRLDAVANKVKSVNEKPRVFFELDATLFTAGPDSFVDDLIVKAGGVNIAADAKTQFPQLNLESLVQKDPEVIFLADHQFGETPEKVATRPGWQSISAVKKGRIYPLNPDLVNRPGPRVVDGLEIMAKALHPDLFK